MKKFVVLLVLLAGCASGPRYQNYQGENAACIKGDTANLIKYFTHGEADVKIVEIDGVLTGRGQPYCVVPGKHRLGISAYNNERSGEDYVDLDLDPGRRYLLRANLRGISFAFQLVDITSEAEKIVAEFSIKASSTSYYTPIFIPVFIR